MTFSTTFTPGMRGADPSAQQTDAADKPKRRGLFGRKLHDQGTAQGTQQAPRTATPSAGGVFAEAGQRPQGTRRGFFSMATSFFTASHPDTVRRRTEATGEDFARRANKFEQGNFNRFAGPMFGMGFKNYDRDPSAQPSPPFSAPSGAGNGHAAGPAPFPAGPHGGATGGQGPSPFAAHQQANTGGYAPPPIHDPAAFHRYTSNVGDDFAQRMNGFAQTSAPAGNPFAGIGQANFDQPRTAAPSRQAASVRVDQAKTEYSKTMAKLKAGLEERKEAAQVMVAEEMSLHSGKIDQIGRELNESLQRLDAKSASKMHKMTEELASMDKMLKDLAIQMRPLQRAAFAGGTNSRVTVAVDSETAALRERNADITQLRNDIKEQRAKTQDALGDLSERMSSLRTSIIDAAEMKISDVNIRIDGAKGALSRTLDGMDNDFASAKSAEKQRIAAKYDVRFG
jgi:hypothetical protein